MAAGTVPLVSHRQRGQDAKFGLVLPPGLL